MAVSGVGCLIVEDAPMRYPWQDGLEGYLSAWCASVRHAKHEQGATDAFAKMNLADMRVVCVGVGRGSAVAAGIASRLPAAGLVALGSPFLPGARGLTAPKEQRRAMRFLFAAICPALIVQPAADPRYPASGARALEEMLTSSESVETLILQGRTMQDLLSDPREPALTALRAFFEQRKQDTCAFDQKSV